MSKERLEEIKAQYHLLKRNDYDLGAWDEPFSWLIEQAERVQELEDIIYQDERQAVLEGLYEQNKRYREILEEVRQNLIGHYGLGGERDTYVRWSKELIDKGLEESE